MDKETLKIQSFNTQAGLENIKILYRLFKNGCGSQDSTKCPSQKKKKKCTFSFQHEKAAVHSSSIHKEIPPINQKYCTNASNVFPRLLLLVTFSEIMRKTGRHWWRDVLAKKITLEIKQINISPSFSRLS